MLSPIPVDSAPVLTVNTPSAASAPLDCEAAPSSGAPSGEFADFLDSLGGEPAPFVPPAAVALRGEMIIAPAQDSVPVLPVLLWRLSEQFQKSAPLASCEAVVESEAAEIGTEVDEPDVAAARDSLPGDAFQPHFFPPAAVVPPPVAPAPAAVIPDAKFPGPDAKTPSPIPAVVASPSAPSTAPVFSHAAVPSVMQPAERAGEELPSADENPPAYGLRSHAFSLSEKQPAQITASLSTDTRGERRSFGRENKNTSQLADFKVETKPSSDAGTARAYEQSSMSSTPATFAVPVAASRPSETTASPAPVAAARLVERVAEVAERLASRPAEPVAISIQLDDTHRVDVRVSMREGRVHADFRSDSPEVRAALSHAWEGFARSREGAAQKWADPVFSPIETSPSAVAPVASASDARADSGLAGSGQEQSRRHAPESRPETFFSSRVRPADGTAAVSPSVPESHRPDVSRLLSAVA